MAKIRLGILGGGGDSLIGVLHRIAASMFDKYQLTGGVFNPIWKENIDFARYLELDESRIYKDYETMIAEELKLPKNERMQVVSVLTPNFLHYPMSKMLIEAGFHVICEKPLTTTYAEALDLLQIAKEKNVIFGVTYTYTGYPMIREMKEMIANGIIGEIQRADIQYYQGWINAIIHNKNRRSTVWRLDPKKSGISCCIGDIGTHSFDMLEYLTGMQVQKVLADLNYMYDDNQLDVDGTVLIRLGKNVKGVIRTSQVAVGEENCLTVQIYGSKGALKWEQENPNYVTHLCEGGAMKVLKRGQGYNSVIGNTGIKIPPGHPEGIFDAMGNIYNGIAKAVRGDHYHHSEFPTIEAGKRGMNFIEQVVASHKEGNVWKDLDS